MESKTRVVSMEDALFVRWQTAQALTAGIVQDAANVITALRQQNAELHVELETLKEDLAHIREGLQGDEDL